MLEIKTAVMMAAEAHKDQYRKDGVTPFILHPLGVAHEFVDDLELFSVALLHDAVEDSDLTIADVRKAGASEKQLIILDALTHRFNEPNVDYLDRIIACEQGVDAARIKLVDVNYNLDDMGSMPEKDFERCLKKWAYADGFLRAFLDIHEVEHPVEKVRR